MYVHVEVLEGRGSLAGIGSHATDRIVVRVGQPDGRKGTDGMASETIAAPIVGTAIGLTVPEKLSDQIKHQVTKRAYRRDTNKFQLRLYTLKHTGDSATQDDATWLGIVAIRLLCLTDGFVVERWVPMQPATKTEPGELRIRVVVRENEADACAVLTSNGVAPTHTTPSEGCCCEVCDPQFTLAKPLIEHFVFDEKHVMSDKVGRALAIGCVMS